MSRTQPDNPTAEAISADSPGEPDILVGTREQLFHLLAEASEIEHSLMCSYLYAAFSLKQPDGNGFSPREADAVACWRKAIMGVAIEEMGHLLIVANLTVAIGGQPHFSRPNFPISSGYFPSGVVLRLTPFSFETLDHFIFLERPTGTKLPDGVGFEADEHERSQPHHGLMPSTQDYATVSHLYEAIRVNLEEFSKRSGAEALFLGSARTQVGPNILKMDGVETITDLAYAQRAIAHVVQQGEGSPADREDSHYRRFQQIKREYSALLERNPDFKPAYPVAENPVMRKPPEPEGKVFIDAKPATAILDLANAAYGMLLRFLVQAYVKNNQPEKQSMLLAAIELMHVLGTAARVLVSLPASASRTDVNAGLTFTMLRGVEPFIEGIAEKKLIVERLHQLALAAIQLGSALPASVSARLNVLMARFSDAA